MSQSTGSDRPAGARRRSGRSDRAPVVLAGHPFASTGMGEQLRSHVASLQAVGVEVRVFDLFRNVDRVDEELVAWIEPIETDRLGDGIRLFHINGDEVETTLDRLQELGQDFAGGINVIVPAWELYHYPAIWIRLLARFDEVWALSRWIADALERRGVSTHYVGQAVEVPQGPMLPRRHFGIRESAFVFLAFCDLSSFSARKNPQGVIRLATRLREIEPRADFHFVLKIKEAERDAAHYADILGPASADVTIIARRLTAVATRSLTNACDCCVSLHRAEGFGRTTAEAMFQGRLALATGWSGNLDYMTADNALLVKYALIDIRQEEYPHSMAQSWAEPDLEHAATLARNVLMNRRAAARMASFGATQVRDRFSFVAVGLRIVARLSAIEQNRSRKHTARTIARGTGTVGSSVKA